MDSMTTGKDSGGQSGVKYTLNGGGYISQTTRLFGLGKQKIIKISVVMPC